MQCKLYISRTMVFNIFSLFFFHPVKMPAPMITDDWLVFFLSIFQKLGQTGVPCCMA